MKIKKFTIKAILTLIIIIYAIITLIQIIPPTIIKRRVNPATESEQMPYSIFLTISILKALDNIAKTNFTGVTEELKISIC